MLSTREYVSCHSQARRLNNEKAGTHHEGRHNHSETHRRGRGGTHKTPAIPEYRFDVTGGRRKALVAAVKDFTNSEVVYKGVPSYAYMVGDCIIDRAGALIGKAGLELLTTLAEQGFIPAGSDAA